MLRCLIIIVLLQVMAFGSAGCFFQSDESDCDRLYDEALLNVNTLESGVYVSDDGESVFEMDLDGGQVVIRQFRNGAHVRNQVFRLIERHH